MIVEKKITNIHPNKYGKFFLYTEDPDPNDPFASISPEVTDINNITNTEIPTVAEALPETQKFTSSTKMTQDGDVYTPKHNTKVIEVKPKKAGRSDFTKGATDDVDNDDPDEKVNVDQVIVNTDDLENELDLDDSIDFVDDVDDPTDPDNAEVTSDPFEDETDLDDQELDLSTDIDFTDDAEVVSDDEVEFSNDNDLLNNNPMNDTPDPGATPTDPNNPFSGIDANNELDAAGVGGDAGAAGGDPFAATGDATAGGADGAGGDDPFSGIDANNELDAAGVGGDAGAAGGDDTAGGDAGAGGDPFAAVGDGPDTTDDGGDFGDTGDGEADGTDATAGADGGGPKGSGVNYDSTRRYMLFKNYISLSNAIKNYIEKLENKISDNASEANLIKIAVSRLKEVEQLCYDYTIMRFELSTYIQSLLFYQNLIVQVQLIFDFYEKGSKKLKSGNKIAKGKKNKLK